MHDCPPPTSTGLQNEFCARFKALTGYDAFPWQQRLFGNFIDSRFPPACEIPTGLGKTSVVAIWLLAAALEGWPLLLHG